MLSTAESEHGARLPLLPPDRGAELAPTLFWQASRPANLSASTAGRSEAIEVYINHSRWIAECPDCHGAQLASRSDHRFLCHCCGNSAIGGIFRPVLWPSAATTAKIEEALEVRMMPTNRNWVPVQSVKDLLDENAEMIQEIR